MKGQCWGVRRVIILSGISEITERSRVNWWNYLCLFFSFLVRTMLRNNIFKKRNFSSQTVSRIFAKIKNKLESRTNSSFSSIPLVQMRITKQWLEEISSLLSFIIYMKDRRHVAPLRPSSFSSTWSRLFLLRRFSRDGYATASRTGDGV